MILINSLSKFSDQISPKVTKTCLRDDIMYYPKDK